MYYRIIILVNIILVIISGCGPETPPDWASDVAPILYKNCVVCHRPGAPGPFSLITYKDAAKRAKTIAKITLSRTMPPWPADPGYTHFLEERRLTDQEIEILQQWAKAKAPAGDTTQKPIVPIYQDGLMDKLGKPDLILKMPSPFFIPGDNTDHFLAMKFPFQLPEKKPIKAIEFVPGNRELVHHLNGHLLSYVPQLKKDVFEGEPWIDEKEISHPGLIHRKLGLLQDDGSYPALQPSVINYLPGVFYSAYPNGIGGYVFPEKGALYIKNLHYGPSPIDTFDQSYFRIYFDKDFPKRPTQELILGTLGVSAVEPPLIIPPNKISKYYSHLLIKEDISLLTLNPHMHLIGKSFKAWALTPDQDTIRLISIPRWDFRWQYFYTFPQPVKIPKGSTIWAEGVFDNTEKNPNNPYSPPQEIREREGSMKTTDEMFQFILTYIPYQSGDENISLKGD
jgi:hypothetical protein